MTDAINFPDGAPVPSRHATLPAVAEYIEAARACHQHGLRPNRWLAARLAELAAVARAAIAEAERAPPELTFNALCELEPRLRGLEAAASGATGTAADGTSARTPPGTGTAGSAPTGPRRR